MPRRSARAELVADDPKREREHAPPAPWITRPTIITVMIVASAATTVPRPSTRAMKTSMRSLPNMSPSRPMIGVSTEALSR